MVISFLCKISLTFNLLNQAMLAKRVFVFVVHSNVFVQNRLGSLNLVCFSLFQKLSVYFPLYYRTYSTPFFREYYATHSALIHRQMAVRCTYTIHMYLSAWQCILSIKMDKMFESNAFVLVYIATCKLVISVHTFGVEATLTMGEF